LAVSRKKEWYRHSRDRQIPSLRAMHPDPTISINTETAIKLNIKDGDMVQIETKRGKIQQKAFLSDDLDPRVVEIDYGWYFPERKDKRMMDWTAANINILTDNKPPFNPEMGSAPLRGFACKVYKAS